MVSVLPLIGSLIPFNMVPHGRYEPAIVVGHTRIKDHPGYKYPHIRDDIINGGFVKTLTLLHAARDPELAVTWPVSGQSCPNEWPPWPNFGRDSARQCGAFEPSWGNGTLFADHNWHSKLHRAKQSMEQQYQFDITAKTERGFLEKIRMETRETEQRERFPKSQMSEIKANQKSKQTQSQPRPTAAAEISQTFFVDFSLQTWLMAMAIANLTSRDTPRPTYGNDSEIPGPKIFSKVFTNEFWGPPSLPHLNDHIKTNKGLIGYSDASWHKSDELGYDMFGYCVFMYGGLISFAAKRLKVIALSSAEAEYAAASYTSKEVMFIRNVFDSLGIKLNGPTILAVDNEAAIKIADNRGVTARNKHFQDAVHYIRHLIDFNYIKLAFVRTHNQRADGFTKPLAKPQFREWCKYLINGVSLS